MAKKIITFENHDSCNFCDFANFETYSCVVTKKEFSDGLKTQLDKGEKVKPIWCPAKNIPEYKMDWSGGDSYEAGWNDVLDLIGGEK